jgi:DNA-binding GntR family transcriptional regulator
MRGSEGLAHTPLRDQIRDRLRRRIATGALAPGSKIIERELASEFGVSRLPVREALRALESEGFVEVVPRRGVIVKTLSRSDVEELFDVREALETLLARRAAAQHHSPAALRRMSRPLERAQRAAEAKRFDQFGDANIAFHNAITELAGNRLLGRMLDPLQSRLDWLFRQVDDPDRLCAEHSELYHAIVAGDADTAAEVAATHVRHSRATALRLLFDASASAPDGAVPC